MRHFRLQINCAQTELQYFNLELYIFAQVDSAFYPPWYGKMSISQNAVMLCGWEGNRRPGGK